MKQIKICTRTGIHTCRLGSIHLNERDKSVLEDYITTLTAEHEEELREAIRKAYWAGVNEGGEDYAGEAFDPDDFLPTKTDKQ